MIPKQRLILPIACFLLLLTGCWGRREMNDLAIVLAAGIDPAKSGFRVTLQVVDPSQMSRNRATNRSPAILYSGEGATISEAIQRISTKSSRQMYLSHLQIVLINEQLARRGISEPIDPLIRNPLIRPDAVLAVSRGYSTEAVLALVTPFEVNPAMDIYKSLRVSEKIWAPSFATRLLDLEMTLLTKGKQPVLTAITLTGNVKQGRTQSNVEQPLSKGEYRYTGLGVFQGDRLLGWLDEMDSKAFTFLANRVKRTISHVECPSGEGFASLEIHSANARMIPRVRQGRPEAVVKLKLKANIQEVQCRINLTRESDLFALQRLAADETRQTIMDGILHVQHQFGSDIFGFGEAFHHTYPQYWKHWSKDWNKRFAEMPITLELDYRIDKLGKISSPIHNQ